jgi:hypothetical protein
MRGAGRWGTRLWLITLSLRLSSGIRTRIRTAYSLLLGHELTPSTASLMEMLGYARKEAPMEMVLPVTENRSTMFRQQKQEVTEPNSAQQLTLTSSSYTPVLVPQPC